MSKLTLSDLVNLQNEGSAVTTINANAALIETAIDNTLSRNGQDPNQMGADLDMNDHSILNLMNLDMHQHRVMNLSNPVSPTDAVNAAYLTNILAGIASTGINPVNNPSGYVSVTAFGAVLDGVTDDTDAIQDALDSGNKTVIIPSGVGIALHTGITIPAGVTFYIGKGAVLKASSSMTGLHNIVVSGDAVTICGEGTIDGDAQLGSGTPPDIISASLTTGLIIKDVTIQKSKGAAIVTQTVSNVLIENVTIVDVEGSDVSINYDIADISDIKIINCHFDRMNPDYDEDNVQQAIYAFSSNLSNVLSRISILNNTILTRASNTTGNPTNGSPITLLSGNTVIRNYEDVVVSGNTVTGGTIGISLGGSNSTVVSNNSISAYLTYAMEVGNSKIASITGNSIDGTSASNGILIDGLVAVPSVLVTITGNSITGPSNSAIQIASNSVFTLISSNTIQVVSGSGILLQNSLAGDLVISSNFMDGQLGGTHAISIGPTSHPVYIHGNRFTRWTSTCVEGLGASSLNDEVCSNFYDTGTCEDLMVFKNGLMVGDTGDIRGLLHTANEIAIKKSTASGTAPGTLGAKLAVVAGTNAGTAKLIMYAGTSTTPTTIIDNVGAGVT